MYQKYVAPVSLFFFSRALIMQIDSPMDLRHSFPLSFERLPEVSQWTDSDVNNAIDLVYQNLNKLESYISIMVRTLSHYLRA